MAWGGIRDCVTLSEVYDRANTVRLFSSSVLPLVIVDLCSFSLRPLPTLVVLEFSVVLTGVNEARGSPKQ